MSERLSKQTEAKPSSALPECSICGSEVDLDGEGGTVGFIGIIELNLCVWCYSGIMDMARQQLLEECEDCGGVMPNEEVCSC